MNIFSILSKSLSLSACDVSVPIFPPSWFPLFSRVNEICSLALLETWEEDHLHAEGPWFSSSVNAWSILSI